MVETTYIIHHTGSAAPWSVAETVTHGRPSWGLSPLGQDGAGETFHDPDALYEALTRGRSTPIPKSAAFAIGSGLLRREPPEDGSAVFAFTVTDVYALAWRRGALPYHVSPGAEGTPVACASLRQARDLIAADTAAKAPSVRFGSQHILGTRLWLEILAHEAADSILKALWDERMPTTELLLATCAALPDCLPEGNPLRSRAAAATRACQNDADHTLSTRDTADLLEIVTAAASDPALLAIADDLEEVARRGRADLPRPSAPP